MFEEPSESPAEQALDPAQQAREKAGEFRSHGELCAVFEGTRKFDAELAADLDPQLARDLQRRIGTLEKAKTPESPILPAGPATDDAAAVLMLPSSGKLSTNDYHVHRRPGEVMIARWLAADQVTSFYERLQAHFDAALTECREEERQQQWKQDPKAMAYLAALDAVELRLEDWYLRDAIRTHKLFVLSTQSADELNIAYLSDYVMGVSSADIVGTASAPPDEPTERDLAWFFKLFSLRGMDGDLERMFFFAYLQKADDSF